MKVFNKRARFDYSLLERYEAGIVLSGAEVKAIKDGGLNLNQAHARVIDGEVFLVNANISLISNQSTRSRKLMLHKKEITSIQSKIKAKKLTLVPVSVYTKGRLVKVGLALAKAKRKYQKKEVKKKRDIQREAEREIGDYKR